MNDKLQPWLPVSKLRKIDINISGEAYTYDWAKNHNLLEKKCGEAWVKLHTVFILEPIEIRMNKDGNIEYRTTEEYNKNHRSDFHTDFGMFHSDDRGEFGGELILPVGGRLGGNFIDVFDFQNKVYAIDSICHMMMGNFSLYEFNDGSNYRCLYEVGGFGERHNESLSFEAYCITPKGIYILLSGEVTNESEKDIAYKDKWISRLLLVSNGTVEEVIEIKESFANVQNIIVSGDILYIAANKMLAIINVLNGDAQYYTFINKRAENNLLKVRAAYNQFE